MELETIRRRVRAGAAIRARRRGKKLMKGLDQIAADTGLAARSMGLGPMPFFKFPKEEAQIKLAFYAETIKRGVYFAPDHVWFLSAAHTDGDIDRTLDVSAAALRSALKSAR